MHSAENMAQFCQTEITNEENEETAIAYYLTVQEFDQWSFYVINRCDVLLQSHYIENEHKSAVTVQQIVIIITWSQLKMLHDCMTLIGIN